MNEADAQNGNNPNNRFPPQFVVDPAVGAPLVFGHALQAEDSDDNSDGNSDDNSDETSDETSDENSDSEDDVDEVDEDGDAFVRISLS